MTRLQCRPGPVTRRAAFQVFLLALATRLVYLLAFRPAFTGEYWDVSTGLLEGGSLAQYGVPTTRFEPLYPLFLWATRALSGDVAAVSQTLQVAVASLGAVAVFLLTDLLTARRRVASIAAIVFAVYPLLIRHAAAPSESALTTALLPLFAWGFLRAHEPRHAALAGVCLGLVVLNRTVALPLLFVVGALLLWQRRPRHALALVAAALVVVAPMLARNYLVGGVLLPSRHGVTLFMGNTRYASALMPEHSPDILQAHAYRVALERAPGLDINAGTFDDDIDSILAAAAYEEIIARPLQTLALKARYVW
jgi:hypothetical protein